MISDKRRKILSFIIIFVCWVPQIKFLFPIPTMEVAGYISSFATKSFSRYPEIADKVIPDQKDYSIKNVYHNLWQHWLVKASLIVIGVLTGIAIYKDICMWHVLTILLSSVYLTIWHLTGSTSSVPLIQSYKLKFKLAEAYNQYGTFVYKEILLPLIFFCIIFTLIYDMLTQQPPTKAV